MLVPLVNALLLSARARVRRRRASSSCCHPPHPTRPDISQAVYLKGTAGIEIDLVDIQDYIDKGKEIEFSLVFKEEYDPLSTCDSSSWGAAAAPRCARPTITTAGTSPTTLRICGQSR